MVPAGVGMVDQDLTSWLAVVLAQVLPDSRSFTARATTHPPANAAQKVSFDLAWDEGMLALDLDPPSTLGGVLDTSRWGRLRLVLDPQGRGWIAFGGLRQWCPLPAGSFQGLNQAAQDRLEEVRWVREGIQVYRGLEVGRYRMTQVFKEEKGNQSSPAPPPAWVWKAPSQGEQVVRARLESSGGLVYELDLDQIRQGKPAANRFQKPDNFQKVDSIQVILLNSFAFPARQ